VRVEWDGPIWGMHVPVDAYSVEFQLNDSQHWLYMDTVVMPSICTVADSL